MSILSTILGVLMIIGGVCCMFTPFSTFLSAGVMIAIMLFVFGIFGIVDFFQRKNGRSALELISSILAIIVGVIAIVRPGGILVMDDMVLYMVSAWLIVKGFINIIVSIREKDEVKGWGWGVAAGVLSIIAGVLSFIHPMVTALTVGVLMGLYFVECGIDMIVFGSALKLFDR